MTTKARTSIGLCPLLLALLFLLTAAVPARGGAIAPCSDPQVFDGAAVNAVILPYRYTGERRFEMLGEAAQKLTRLVQLEVLFSLIKHGSIGAVELQQNEPAGCDVDRVLASLTSGGGPGRVRPGHGLILLWGRLYEEGDTIYLQNYLKFLRRGDEESLTFAPEVSSGAAPVFTARLPAQALAFAPRRLTRGDLEQIIAEFSRAAVIRPRPDLTVAGEPLAAWDPWRRFAYWVTDVEGDWIRIEAQDRSTRGWVKARGSEPTSPLLRKMPELAFLDGVAGYLRHQVGRDREEVSPAPDATLRRVRTAFATYQGALNRAREPLPRALARSLEGFLLMDGPDGSPPDRQRLERAATLFAQARELVPYNAAARNLAAVGELMRIEGEADTAAAGRDLTRSLLDALAVDPGSEVTLGNLENLYRYLLAHPARTSVAPAELEQQLLTLQRIRSAERR